LFEFSVDYPENINITQDLCLASAGSEWNCVTRSYVKQNDGKLVYKFDSFGKTYAVIYSPDPLVYARYYCEERWVCRNHQVLFGIVLLSLTIFTFFFVWAFRTLVKTKGKSQKSEIKKRQE